MTTMIDPDKAIDLGKLFIGGWFAAVLAILIMKMLGYSVYRYQKKSWRIGFYLFTAASFIGFIGFIVLLTFISTPLVISLSPTAGILLILLMAVMVAGLFYKEKDKGPWLPLIPLLSCYAIGGILFRLDTFSNILSSEHGALIVAGCLIVAMVVQYGVLFVVYRSRKKIN